MNYVVILLTFFLFACASNHHQSVDEEKRVNAASSMLESPDGQITGRIDLENMENNIIYRVRITGLSPNSEHGFHIHQNGLCDPPDYKSAGGHLNPYDRPHGGPGEKKSHLGDLGNLKADSSGVATKDMTIMKEHDDDWEMILGKAFILHAKADDLKSQPTGDAGGRIACGIIKPVD